MAPSALGVRDRAPAEVRVAKVALVVPLSGPLGLTGPSCLASAELARAEVNMTGGLLGRTLDFVVIDGGRSPGKVNREVSHLLGRESIAAVVGMHTSSVRLALLPLVAGRLPYVYTPPYEGGDRLPGVFHCGETPGQQLLPAVRWLVENRAAHRWLLLGNDYVWPRVTNRIAQRVLRAAGCEITDDVYVSFGHGGSGRVLDKIRRDRPDAVLVNLIGQDLVEFNRRFVSSGLGDRPIRISTALEENVLLGIGGDSTGGLYGSMAYFSTLATDAGLDFMGRYVDHFGFDAPVLTGHGQSCYEGVRMLAEMAAKAGSLHPAALDDAAEGVRFAGARGELVVHDRHVRQPVYLARAEGMSLEVVAGLSPRG